MHAQGDLFDEVKRRGGRLPESEVVRCVLYPYLCALAYLHDRGIIHRDIKPENTVFTRDKVKLGVREKRLHWMRCGCSCRPHGWRAADQWLDHLFNRSQILWLGLRQGSLPDCCQPHNWLLAVVLYLLPVVDIFCGCCHIQTAAAPAAAGDEGDRLWAGCEQQPGAASHPAGNAGLHGP